MEGKTTKYYLQRGFAIVARACCRPLGESEGAWYLSSNLPAMRCLLFQSIQFPRMSLPRQVAYQGQDLMLQVNLFTNDSL